LAARPEQIHSNYLGQHIAAGNADVTYILALLSGRFASHGAATASVRGVVSLSAFVQREATVLAYIDWLTLWFAIAATA
jgi:DHA2 family multidrug resistance protein